jgi:hypothetical protein
VITIIGQLRHDPERGDAAFIDRPVGRGGRIGWLPSRGGTTTGIAAAA